VFDHFMPPENRVETEVELLEDLEYFCLADGKDFKSHDVLLKAFFVLKIFQVESILLWEKGMAPYETIDKSINDFRFISKQWIHSLKNEQWYVNATFCDSGCDCTEHSDSEKLPDDSNQRLKWGDEKFIREFYEPSLDDVETSDILNDYTVSFNGSIDHVDWADDSEGIPLDITAI
jgi:hypothetical protein